MRRLWIGAVLLVVGATACGKKEPASDATSGRKGKERMPAMVGMGQQERMEPGGGASAPDTAGVPVDRAAANRLGITFARAARRPIAAGSRVVGSLTYAEPRRVYVNARVNGWVERLY